ncbi:Uncharacterized protein TCM_018264 [Theobroma cacao]|uniref:Uncharacterized protein n=1 Tax=Theobroma cacao TaxID=3641 RepID=A0A061EFC3_THECC|nr:Uncharacterized protein TCM_018264 [Theobroma cacao]
MIHGFKGSLARELWVTDELLDMVGAMVCDYSWQGHGLLYVARPQVVIRNCDHLISPMSANIVKTTMAVGTRWSRAPNVIS